MTEAQLQKQILDFLDDIGAWTVKTITVNKRGTPDILACLDGTFYAIEVKRPGKLATVSKLQKYQLRQIKDAGGVALAVDDFEEVKKLFADVYIP